MFGTNPLPESRGGGGGGGALPLRESVGMRRGFAPHFRHLDDLFAPQNLTMCTISFRSCWVPFWTSSRAPLLIFTRSGPPDLNTMLTLLSFAQPSVFESNYTDSLFKNAFEYVTCKISAICAGFIVSTWTVSVSQYWFDCLVRLNVRPLLFIKLRI